MAPKQGETTKFSSGKTWKNIMEKNYSHKKQRFYKILRGAFQNFWPPLPLPGSRDFQLMYFFSFPILLWYSGDWWALPCCFCGALIKSPCIFPSLNDNFCNYGKKNSQLLYSWWAIFFYGCDGSLWASLLYSVHYRDGVS